MTCPARFKEFALPAPLRCTSAVMVFACAIVMSFAVEHTVAAQDSKSAATSIASGPTPEGNRDGDASAVDLVDLDAMNTIPAALREAVSNLDADSFEVRREASNWLGDDQWDKLDAYEILEFAQLSPEQRVRLLGALHDRLMYTPMGAIGIRSEFVRPEFAAFGTVRVIDVLQGLPAERVLRINDVITHIDGRRPTHSNFLGDYVQRKLPGEQVVIRVKRRRIGPDGRIATDVNGEFVYDDLTFNVELGHNEKLDEFNEPWQRRGRRQTSNIRTERRYELNRAMHDYGLPTRTIVVRGSGEEVSTTAIGGRADGHDAVLRTQDELRRVRSGLMRYDDMLETWERRRISIKTAFGRPGITAEEQQLLSDVLDRMNELIEQARPSWGEQVRNRRRGGRRSSVL